MSLPNTHRETDERTALGWAVLSAQLELNLAVSHLEESHRLVTLLVMMKMKAEGTPLVDIGLVTDMDKATVSRILARKSWADVHARADRLLQQERLIIYPNVLEEG